MSGYLQPQRVAGDSSLESVPLIGTALSGALIVSYTFLFFLGWHFPDDSMERWKLTFREKREFALANALVFCSFGTGTSLFVFIPGLNPATVPFCAVGDALGV